MKKINTPSYSSLIPREKRIKAIQNLYFSLKKYIEENEARMQDILGVNADNITALKDLLNDSDKTTGLLSEILKKADKASLSTVATSGEYNDLLNKPTLFSGDYNDLTNKPSLFSGDYNDLVNTPSIPSLEGYATEQWVTNKNYLTEHQSLADYALKSELFSGSYNDLTDKPTIPNTETFALKSELFSGSYNDLTDTPTIPTVPTDVSAFNNDAGYLTQHQTLKTINGSSIVGEGNITIEGGSGTQVQSDWTQTDDTQADFIKNKPTIPTVPTNVSAFTNDAGYLTEHQSLSNYALKSEVPSIWTGTQAEYDALTSINESTIYIIKES